MPIRLALFQPSIDIQRKVAAQIRRQHVARQAKRGQLRQDLVLAPGVYSQALAQALAKKEFDEWKGNGKESWWMTHVRGGKAHREALFDGFHIEFHELAIELGDASVAGIAEKDNAALLGRGRFQGGVQHVPERAAHGLARVATGIEARGVQEYHGVAIGIWCGKELKDAQTESNHVIFQSLVESEWLKGFGGAKDLDTFVPIAHIAFRRKL